MSKRLTIELMKDIAIQRGGVCLSDVYLTKNDKLEWQCRFGHVWLATPDSVKNSNRWCHVCGGSDVRTLEEMKTLAKQKGGECLSTSYLNLREKLEWKCEKGHIWSATGGKIKFGRWCPYCARKAKLTLPDLRRIAEERGGKCLSDIYINSKTSLLWQCEKGHKWKAAAMNIKNQEQWCPYCAGLILELSTLQDLAISRNGKLLSTEYFGNKGNLEWQCDRGHIWKASPNAVQRGTWCPKCPEGRGEQICRMMFEQLFNCKFVKSYPKWLQTQSFKRGLELDGYCKELKLAFEHHGLQHYKRLNLFHRTEADFFAQQDRDKIKEELCRENGITLIVIPEIPYLLKYVKVLPFIKAELAKHGIVPPNTSININLNEVYHSRPVKNCMEAELSKKQGLMFS